MNIVLPTTEGLLKNYTLKNREFRVEDLSFPFNRTAFAAVHVIADPTKPGNPWNDTIAVDWEKTLKFRAYLWDLGFHVAEAMDTAQRGMGINWETASELIVRSAQYAKTLSNAPISCGVGTDQMLVASTTTIQDVLDAYREQFDVVESTGANVILMASQALCAIAKTADEYHYVYSTLLQESKGNVILHWLGEVFDPLLRGYWGSIEIASAMETVLAIINDNVSKIDGIKISLLDAKWEIELRNRLPKGVRMYTGDDFNYDQLIAGDEKGFSHALLGIFDPIAPIAAQALGKLADEELDEYYALLAPTVLLSRKLFCAPTRYYKAGVVFLSWLNGHQDHFTMLGGVQSSRSLLHYSELFELADQAGIFIRPELALRRMQKFLAVYGGIS